jgi:bifunctional non-homologous end joining protein LigD
MAHGDQTERAARFLMWAMYRATDGERRWWVLPTNLNKMTKEAIAAAVDRGWMIDRGDSVCLTDAGRESGQAGQSTAQLPLIERKGKLARLFKMEMGGLRYSEHVIGDGPCFRAQACKLGLEGAVSKLADRPYAPGDRGIWLKSKCLNCEEFVVVGWTDPEGSRSHIGALLVGYYTDDGRLHYAGRAGTGMTEKELKRLAGVLAPLQVAKMPLAEAPPRDSRFGSPLKLSRVHWVQPEVVVEVTYLTWTEDNLLRQVSYQGQREDKPSRQVVRLVPHPQRRR